jgi:Predicted transcriptional regulator, contains C-terminal CBS domains
MSEDLITVDKDQNLSDALKLLRKHNVSRLPVTIKKKLSRYYFRKGHSQQAWILKRLKICLHQDSIFHL